MRKLIGLLVSTVLLVAVGSIAWSAVGSASTPVTAPSEATYATHLLKNPANAKDWRGQEDVAAMPGWYKYEVVSYTAPSCWYVSGKGAVGWPGWANSGDVTGFVQVLKAGVSVSFKCANGHAAGAMFVTLIPTTMSGTP